ncbi:MAG: ABC transporter ATP-binding protein [Calditrichia bacterium]|nr:ABC transporter ATP-binding protein [Calditrichota bacterium]MCB0268113.1 ABC transporter ATP-binding protein [Calditrichota bacterium]MCB0286144.1 ABC transporter ATP-binding protein [Calditrichota bacterium]MCB9068923.1 ABC transporter ATP-binding protein [Calditrichia bacterium]
MDVLIRARGLKRTYYRALVEVNALKGVDLDIRKGEFVAIMGPSGSGKSTLMNLLGCLDKPTGGEYKFDDVEIAKLDDRELSQFRNQRVGFIFQSFNLIPQLTIEQNVELPLIYSGISRIERRNRATEQLKQVKLGHRLGHHPNELSGGENQRVATARALVVNPDIILADEPTGNLDTKTGEEIMQLISGLHKKGVTIILVTHDVWVANWADRIIQMKDGLIQQEFREKITADMLQL